MHVRRSPFARSPRSPRLPRIAAVTAAVVVIAMSLMVARPAAAARPDLQVAGFSVPQATRLLADEQSTGVLYVVDLYRLEDGLVAAPRPIERDRRIPFAKLVTSYDDAARPDALSEALAGEVRKLAVAGELEAPGDPVPVTRAVAGRARTGLRFEVGEAAAFETYAFEVETDAGPRTVGVVIRDDARDDRERLGLGRLLENLAPRAVRPDATIRRLVGGVVLRLPARHRLTSGGSRSVDGATITELEVEASGVRMQLRVVVADRPAIARAVVRRFGDQYVTLVRQQTEAAGGTIRWLGETFFPGRQGLDPLGVARIAPVEGADVRVAWGAYADGSTAVGFGITTAAATPETGDRAIMALLDHEPGAAVLPPPTALTRADGIAWAVPAELRLHRPAPSDGMSSVYASAAPARTAEGILDNAISSGSLLLRRVVIEDGGDVTSIDRASNELAARAVAALSRVSGTDVPLPEARDRTVQQFIVDGESRDLHVLTLGGPETRADPAGRLTVRTFDAGVDARGRRVLVQAVTPRTAAGFADAVLARMVVSGLDLEAPESPLQLGFATIATDDSDLAIVAPRGIERGGGAQVRIERDDVRLTVFPADPAALGDLDVESASLDAVARTALRLALTATLDPIDVAGFEGRLGDGGAFEQDGLALHRFSAVVRIDGEVVILNVIAPGPRESAATAALAAIQRLEPIGG